MNNSDEKQISYDIAYMWNLIIIQTKSIYKTETESQTYKTTLWSSTGAMEGQSWGIELTDTN